MSRTQKPCDGVGVVERLAVRHARTAVVTDQSVRVVPQGQHHLVHVARHRLLVVTIARFVGVAVAAEIRADDRILLGAPWRDLAPHLGGLWIAVEQEDGRAVAGHPQVDLDAVGSDRAVVHPGHEVHVPSLPLDA
jgi:hypothetical protein